MRFKFYIKLLLPQILNSDRPWVYRLFKIRELIFHGAGEFLGLMGGRLCSASIKFHHNSHIWGPMERLNQKNYEKINENENTN